MPGYERLLRAIKAQSVQRVLEVLEIDPCAACGAIFEYDGYPPLCAAVTYGCRPEIVQVLLEHDADVHAQNWHRETALGLLCHHAVGRPYIPEAFAAPEPIPWNRELEATNCRHMAVAAMLVEAGTDPTEKNNGGQSCLELAAAARNEPLFTLLGGQEMPQVPFDDAIWNLYVERALG